MFVRHPARISLVAVIGSALLAVACGQNANEPAEADAADAQTAEVPVGAPTATTASGEAGSNLWAGGRSIPLDIQVAHPNGVVLQLTSLQSRATETAVGIRVLNGRDREVHLNRFNNRDGYIVTDTNERIYLSPPAGNTGLALPAGQTLEGELVFLGRLPQARSAILILNENSTTDSQYSTTPGFRINLPLDQLASGGSATTAAAPATAQPASPAQ